MQRVAGEQLLPAGAYKVSPSRCRQRSGRGFAVTVLPHPAVRSQHAFITNSVVTKNVYGHYIKLCYVSSFWRIRDYSDCFCSNFIKD